MVKQRTHKQRSILQLVVGVLAAVLLVLLSGLSFYRLDLTEEKRHTLTDSTIEMLEELEDIVYVKVYLSGEYPAEYKRLESAIRERLNEMRAYADVNLQYEFINPSESEKETERAEMYNYLQESGLQYTNITFKTKDGVSEKIIFPGALVTYKGETEPLQLLKNNERAIDPEMLNTSVNNLEYNFAQIIRRMTTKRRARIAFVSGHGELSRIETNDAERLLQESYSVSRVEMDGSLNALTEPLDTLGKRRMNKYELLIIAKPTKPWSDADRFHLDQFIMRGGKVMWFVDPIDAELDSLRLKQESTGRVRDVNLDDLLFSYGVRLNNDLLLDRNCAPIAITTGMKGDKPQMELFPWYFKPVMAPTSSHPIVDRVDPIVGEFVSSMEILDRPGVEATTILTSSENTRILRAPVRINLNVVSIDPDFKDKKRPYQNVAVLLEGVFESPLYNLIDPAFYESGFQAFAKSQPTKMLVVSDGDLIKNRVSADGSNYFALGFDRYTNDVIYGNRDFLLNTVNYMLDDSGLISIRSRSISLRKMNEERLLFDREWLQVVNVGLPILLIIIVGLILNLIRRKRNSTG